MDVKALICRRLSEEGERLVAAFQALAPEEWDLPIYSEGARWTPREILAHQLSTERGIHALVRDVLAGGPGVPEGFDRDAFNEEWAARLAAAPAETLYHEFRGARAALIATVTAMAPGDFARAGRHPWFGQANLEDTLKLLYRHNMLHLRDVQRAVRAQHRAQASAQDSAQDSALGSALGSAQDSAPHRADRMDAPGGSDARPQTDPT
jgi:hypothetical protein